MCRIITVANQKGGVTKTTICQHLSYILAEQGRRVLCVDFDPQTNLTSSLLSEGQAPALNISGIMARLLEDQDLPDPSSYIQRCGKVDLISGSKSLGKTNLMPFAANEKGFTSPEEKIPREQTSPPLSYLSINLSKSCGGS